MKSKKEVAIVYLVAGISSRFNGKIKQLVKINSSNQTLIEYSLDQAIKAGFSKIIFVVGNKTEKPFKKKFKKSYKGVPVLYAQQKFNEKYRDKPWGTSDALCSAKKLLKCRFVVCNGDDIYGENSFKILFNHLKNKNKKSNEEAIVSYKLKDVLPKKGTVNRGILKTSKGYVKSIKDSMNLSKKNLKSNKFSPNDLCSMNLFALHPKILKYLCSELRKFKKKHKGNRKIELRLPHELTRLIKNKKIKIKVYLATDKWIGITNPGDEKKVKEFIKDYKDKK